MRYTCFFIIILAFILTSIDISAQEKSDTVVKGKSKEKPTKLVPYHWNVIKFNPTPMLIQGMEIRNLTFSYERLITKTMSVALQAGYLIFPKLIDDSIAGIVALSGRNKYGVNVAFDYRYYPFQRNRRPAPDGLYIGGYLSYYGYNFKNNFNILHTTADQNGAMKGRLNIVNLGFELGYQFIFWKRLSLDLLLFGPSLSLYYGSLEIEGDLDEEQIRDIDDEVVQRLLNRFPMLKSLFAGETLKFTGSRSNLSAGLRYSIQLGFHF